MFRVTINNILVIILLIIMLSYPLFYFHYVNIIIYFSPYNLLGERLDNPCSFFHPDYCQSEIYIYIAYTSNIWYYLYNFFYILLYFSSNCIFIICNGCHPYIFYIFIYYVLINIYIIVLYIYFLQYIYLKLVTFNLHKYIDIYTYIHVYQRCNESNIYIILYLYKPGDKYSYVLLLEGVANH